MTYVTELFEIIIRKRKVSDLTFEPAVAVIAGAVLVALGAYANSLNQELSSPMVISLAQYILNTALIMGMLQLNGNASRSVQVLSALYGTSAILQGLTMGLQLLQIPALLIVFLIGWNFYITIVIFKEGIDSWWLPSLLWVIAISGITLFLMTMIFPDFAALIQSTVDQMQAQSNA